jgi:hypothetical protein
LCVVACRQDEELLRQQRAEFLRQEEVKRQTEAQIQAERQKTLDKEFALRKEVAKEQVLCHSKTIVPFIRSFFVWPVFVTG